MGADRPKERTILIVFILVTFALGTVLFKNIVWGLLGAVVIFASTLEMFIPLKFRVTSEGASVKNGLAETEMKFANVKRIWRDNGGIHLSPLEKPSRLDAYRGVYLRFSGNEDQLVGIIVHQLGEHAPELVRGFVGGGD